MIYVVESFDRGYILNSVIKKIIKYYLIWKINKKWSGKEINFCSRIYSDIFFGLNSVSCSCFSASPYGCPVLYRGDMNKFDVISYLKGLDKIMSLNSTGKTLCHQCPFFKKQSVPKLNLANNILNIIINNYLKCNADCIYCVISDKTKGEKYSVLPVIKNFYNDNLIKPKAIVTWGGGEPTMFPDFDETFTFLNKKETYQAINSSGIKFSQTIADELPYGYVSIQVSIDSGTKEMYKKIKKVDAFDKVWDNIKQYSKSPEKVFIKYIIFSLNRHEDEIKEFINKCIWAGVKNIVIDCEMHSLNSIKKNELFTPIGQNEVDAAILLKKLALVNNINYEITRLWPQKYKNLIEES